jgi:hypothetical protein
MKMKMVDGSLVVRYPIRIPTVSICIILSDAWTISCLRLFSALRKMLRQPCLINGNKVAAKVAVISSLLYLRRWSP